MMMMNLLVDGIRSQKKKRNGRRKLIRAKIIIG